MNSNDEERNMVRRYLLGFLSSEETDYVEERFMTDFEYKEQALVIEDELIEDYLAHELSEDERERFVKYFLATPQQRQKLKVAQALDRYFSVEAAATSPPSFVEASQTAAATHVPARFSPRRKRVAFSLAAAAILLIVFGGSWFLYEKRRPSDQAPQAQERNREFQRELTQLNGSGSPGNGESPIEPAKAVALTLTLPPINFRGGGELPEATRPAGDELVQLLLVLPPGEYKRYRAVLQKSGDAPRFTIDYLEAKTTPSGRAISLKIPSRYLTRGDYLLDLSGSNAESQSDFVSAYSFRILN
jgi:hypothetical protein